jgi:protein sidekick
LCFQQRTIEDTPGPVGSLTFQDILLDSVNVSWAPPQQPNGIILNYVVNYRTYKLDEEFRKEVQEKSRLNYLLAGNLEENVTYFFNVRAETSAGLGIVPMTGNVTTGYNEGGGFWKLFEKLIINTFYRSSSSTGEVTYCGSENRE